MNLYRFGDGVFVWAQSGTYACVITGHPVGSEVVLVAESPPFAPVFSGVASLYHLRMHGFKLSGERPCHECELCACGLPEFYVCDYCCRCPDCVEGCDECC